MVAMLVREMPHSSGGLPADLARTTASVGEVLVASQFNEILVKSSSKSAACTCVRAGFMLMRKTRGTLLQNNKEEIDIEIQIRIALVPVSEDGMMPAHCDSVCGCPPRSISPQRAKLHVKGG